MTKSNTTTKSVASTKAPAKANAPVKQSAPAAKAPAKADLSPIEVARQNVAKKVESGVGVTLHTNGKAIKGLAAEPMVAKPTRKHAQRIASIKGHPGKGNCVKRFHLYAVGDTMLHCKTTEGKIWSDVTFYAENGYLTIREGTEEEYQAMLKEWEQAKAKEQEGKATQAA